MPLESSGGPGPMTAEGDIAHPKDTFGQDRFRGKGKFRAEHAKMVGLPVGGDKLTVSQLLDSWPKSVRFISRTSSVVPCPPAHLYWLAHCEGQPMPLQNCASEWQWGRRGDTPRALPQRQY
jgi:hypothetical protein